MSRTELYIVDKNGDVRLYKEYQNSHRGAALLWDNLWKMVYPDRESFWFRNDLDDLWKIDRNFDVPRELRILLISTFDNIVIKKENLLNFIKAIETVLEKNYFMDNGHFKDYPSDLRELLNNNDIIGVCWNQTSVNCDVWIRYDDENDRNYNIFKDNEHQFLFEYLNRIEKDMIIFTNAGKR